MTKPTPVFPSNRHALYEAHGYSAAIASGNLLFVSGQVEVARTARPNRILPNRSDCFRESQSRLGGGRLRPR